MKPDDRLKDKSFRITGRVLFLSTLTWIILLIFTTFFDLEISGRIVDFSSKCGKFIQLFGGVPGMILSEVAFFLLAGSYLNSDNIIRLLALGLLSVTCTVIPYFSFKDLFYRTDSLKMFFVNNSLFIFLFLLVIAIVVIYLLRSLFGDFCKRNRRFAQITVKLFIITYAIITPVLKLFSGRIRFRDLGEGFSGFTPWYVFNGVNGNYSFPSGHTVLGWMLLPLLILVIERSRVLKGITGFLVIGWGLFVAAFRVIYGFHYASDVIFSTGLTLILFLYLLKKHH